MRGVARITQPGARNRGNDAVWTRRTRAIPATDVLVSPLGTIASDADAVAEARPPLRDVRAPTLDINSSTTMNATVGGANAPSADAPSAAPGDKENGADGVSADPESASGLGKAPATEDAPSAAGEDEASADSDESESESSDEEAVGPDGMTKYERQRQANIQRNKELMMQLSLKKMSDKLAPTEAEGGPKKRGPKPGPRGPRKRNLQPSRGSSRIQRLQEERRHTLWKELHVEKALKSHYQCVVELYPRCLGMADENRTFEGGDHGDLLPCGWFGDGDFLSEPLYVWTDFDGKHHVLWGESLGERQRHVETEEGGCDTAAGAMLCIFRELQRRRMQRLGAIPGRGVAKPVYVNIPSHRLPLLDKTKPRPEPPVPEKRPRGRPRKHPLPVKPPKPYVPKPPKQPEVPDAPTCSNCGCAKEETSKMRHGPEGPKTLCNACGMYWATQGMPRPKGLFADDYERVVPPGQIPVESGPVGSKGRPTVPKASALLSEAEATELRRLIDEADAELEEDAAANADSEDASDDASDEDDAEDAAFAAAAAAAEEDARIKAELPSGGEARRRSFFQDMVKCASAGIVTPAMVGADDFPDVIPDGAPAPRWCPHLWVPANSLVGVTEEAAAEVKANPQGSALARAVAAVADSDPIKDAHWENIADMPSVAWYACTMAATALAAYGGAAAGPLLGAPAIFHTAFSRGEAAAARPRVFKESDLDGLTLFGYAETEVQQSLTAQLERYEQKGEQEGGESAERQRDADYAEAVAALDAAVRAARKAMRQADTRADRDAKFERAAPRIETVASAAILCPPLPKAEKQSKKERSSAATAVGAEAAGFLWEDACAAIEGREDVPEPIGVTCGVAPPGTWQPGGRPKEEKITFVGEDKTESSATPAEYERMGGMGHSKKWRKSIRVVETGEAIGDRLARAGAEVGETAIGRRVAIWWPLDERYYLGTVEEFLPATGEHSVRYDDDESEDLLLPMQRVKWLPQGTGPAGEGVLKDASAVPAAPTREKTAEELAAEAARKAEQDARIAEERRMEEEAKGMLSPEGRSRMTMGAFDVWAMRPMQRCMRNSERRKCFEVLTVLRNVPDPDDDPDDEDEPPRLLIEPFETLPTPRELPDYYELIRCPVDCRSLERVLRRHGERCYASPWFFAVAVELMLTNAQTYNDEDSQIYEEAGYLRRAFHRAMTERFPSQPLPPPFDVYANCDEPMWIRPAGWSAPTTAEEVEDEPDPFDALAFEVTQAEDDEERAVARAMKAGGAVYGNDPESIENVARRFGRPGPGRPPAYVPTGRPVGRPRKESYAEDATFDPKRPNGGGSGGGGGGGGGASTRAATAGGLSAVAVAARSLMESRAGESVTLDDVVAAATKAKAPELYGVRRPGSTVLSILRQHPDVFVETLTGSGAKFSLNPRLEEEPDDPGGDAYRHHGPPRTSARAPPKRRYAEPADDDEFEEYAQAAAAEEEEDTPGVLSAKNLEICKKILEKVRTMKVRGRVVGELFELLPTRKQLPDYYKQIANPVDFQSVAKCLNKPGGYHSVWNFLCSVELMFSNAQVYNEENSALWADAATLREAVKKALKEAIPEHPYPEPMSVYEAEKCVEPDWRKPKKPPLKVKMNASSGKGSALKVTIKPPASTKPPALAPCGECGNCTNRQRHKRCFDSQMRDQALLGHAGAKIAVRRKDAIGTRVEIHWPPDDAFYAGTIVGYDPEERAHVVEYEADATQESIQLWGKKELVREVAAAKRPPAQSAKQASSKKRRR